MAFSYLLPFLFVLLLSISSISHGDDLIEKECGSNFTNNDALQANINTVILDLVTNTTTTGFAYSTYGSGNDTVYGTAECRGDITGQDCSACIINAGQEIRKSCTNTIEARIWYQQCSFRYSTTNFIGQADTNLIGTWRSIGRTTDQKAFRKALEELFYVLATATATAAAGESRKFGWGQIEIHNLTITEASAVYGMAQCTWDLEESPCFSCLGAAMNSIKEERDGSYIILKSCAIRYEVSPFLFLNAAPNYADINTRNIIFGNI
ncbi:cysteine-rich repeat secretory protein 55-like [Phalaenopsis equestris]|uniref:cysteine-rich repeat secretory protein 55-like n=1 Tax=Phalaenopsis equestris TaxID=78828 RepID=UPI0009E2C063|nr:cysteine-rich repeat secretory protein 55-like [Phalaenopsis equestris]